MCSNIYGQGIIPIEAIRSIGQNEDYDIGIELAKLGLLPPLDTLESTTGEKEVALGRLDWQNLLGHLWWPETERHVEAVPKILLCVQSRDCTTPIDPNIWYVTQSLYSCN